MPAATSYRLGPELKARLASRAKSEGSTETGLVSRLLDEGLKMAEHPGIVYRDGPTGRRAGLANGPDVWEIVLGIRSAAGRGNAKIADAAAQMDLSIRSVRVAVDFASAYPDEIEDRIKLNDEAAEKVRRMAAERARMLAS